MTDDSGKVRGGRGKAPWQRKERARRLAREERSEPPSSRKTADRLWQAFRPPERSNTPRAKLLDLFGRHKGRVNVKRAAEELGVSQRTVRRWVQTRKIPRSAAGERLRSSHATWRDSAAGRRKALNQSARAQAAGIDAFKYTGWVRISRDRRWRKGMQVPVQDEKDMQRMLGCLADGDDRGAHRALEDIVTAGGFGGSVELDIDHLDIDWDSLD